LKLLSKKGRAKMSSSVWVSEKVYRKLLEVAPIPSVDLIVTRNRGREFALVKRAKRPYEGKFFIPGGRIGKGEWMDKAVHRIALRELGIAVSKARFIGCQDLWNPPKFDVRWHSIWHIYVIEVSADTEFSLNAENSSVGWFTSINPRWPSPVRKALLMAGYK
jgi:colanic acid biosynthesis protein WcaH